MSLVMAPLLAAAMALAGVLLGWRGFDFPAHAYRVWLFRKVGMTMWENGWYGGHWTLGYSVLFPPISGVLGLPLTEILSAGLAAWAFDRVVVTYIGPQARLGAIVFAVWTGAQIATGQLPFLLGEAIALCAIYALLRRRIAWGIALAVAAALTSALAASFLLLVLATWFLTSAPRRRLQIAGVMVLPTAVIVGTGLLFPGEGTMPFKASTLIWILINAGFALIAIPRNREPVRVGLALYVVTVVAAFLIPSPVGANVVRLAQIAGAPLILAVCWPRRRFFNEDRVLFEPRPGVTAPTDPDRPPFAALSRPAQVLSVCAHLFVLGVFITVGLMQWIPAIGAFNASADQPAAKRAYYQPLVRYLRAHRLPLGRVEVVPTELHWEVAYVAPHTQLARGWERQIDTAYNPIFYERDGLQATEYRRWLADNGVRYVALPNTKLDFAGTAEAALLRHGVDGLQPVWHNADWQVWRVAGAPGIVSGPATLQDIDAERIVLQAAGPGVVDVRIRYTNRWHVAKGAACLREGPDRRLQVLTRQPGLVRLAVGLTAATPRC